jgi:hypothetical protein
MRLRRNAKVELLRGVPLFAGCSQRELGQICALADEIYQPDGTRLRLLHDTPAIQGKVLHALAQRIEPALL